MIHLPSLFDSKLKQHPKLYAGVTETLLEFEPWLEQSGMPFFPGFTDHSPRHIHDVLTTAAALISDDAHELLSPEDIAVLTIAILLHDCGMHLTQDGFRALVSTSTASIVGFSDIPWDKLWIEFLAEAQRFGEDRLMSIFGDKAPISTSDIDLENLSERDYLLIGEFVRRHHARLAHEIAINGVPSKGDKKLTIKGLDEDLKDLAGLTARSHGMSIRSTLTYIQNKYNRTSEYRRVKTPFLMAVVRIADYVQVQGERALKSLLSVKELRSPISRQEWRNHFAVSDVSLRHEDPEAMYVHARPTDVKTFLRLESLFKDIQRELDESWATIGEIYGRLGELCGLGMTIRRIRSNIDEKAKFAATVQYIPINSQLKSSGPDLLKLLVGPLYDYDHKVGLRELIQNAVDACQERLDASKGHCEEPKVILEVEETEEGTAWLTITDTGVGMTLETITNYFLVAGASFRNSDLWKRQHTDAQGNSRVMRGGRFGVGALAAFLLGDEITVRTRHFDRDDLSGIEFSARLDDPLIELRRCSAAVGTTIKVWISNPLIVREIKPYINNQITEANQEVSSRYWPAVDWFTQSKPSIDITWHGYFAPTDESPTPLRAIVKFISSKNFTPNTPHESPDWHPLNDPTPYAGVIWRYQKASREDGTNYFPSAREAIVNGIRVQNIREYTREYYLEFEESNGTFQPKILIERPDLAIFDPQGVCPINLQRSSISFQQMGKDSLLARGIVEEYIRRVQDLFIEDISANSYLNFLTLVEELPGLIFLNQILPIYFATRTGISVSEVKSFTSQGIRRIYFIQLTDGIQINEASLNGLLESDEAIFINSKPLGEQSTLNWFRMTFGDSESTVHKIAETGFPNLAHTSECAVMKKKKWESVSAKGKVARDIIRRITVSTLDDSTLLLSSGLLTNTSATKKLRAESALEIDQLSIRVIKIYEALGSMAEISGWNVTGIADRNCKPSFFMHTWQKLNRGLFLSAPK